MELNSIVRLPSTDLTLVTIGLLSIIFYFMVRRDRRIQKYLNKFEGPISLPVVGSALWFIRPNSEFVPLLFTFSEKYKSSFKLWLGLQGTIVIHTAKDAEKLLSSTLHIEKSTEYDLLHNWLGLGLLTAKPNKWHSRRKLLTPAFHFKILEEFLGAINDHGDDLMDVLQNLNVNEKSFDIFPRLTRCTLDIICETAMGIKMNAQKGEGSDYVNAIEGYSKMQVKRVFQPWLQIQWIFNLLGYGGQERKNLKVLHTFTENVIAARKSERKRIKEGRLENKIENHSSEDLLPKPRKAFLDLLLDMADNGESGLTDLEIRNEVDTFMFEGHDTTASALVWTIFLLGLYPQHQQKVQEELDEILGDNKSRELNAGDISKMKYLELCIKESARIYPSVPLFFRHLNEDLDLGNDRVVPRGANMYIASILLHHDPSVFPDPDTFNPERFLPENCVGRSPYAYIPFSAGPRNCIGQKFALMEEKVILAKLFMKFNIQSVHTRKEVKMVPDMILRPVGGIHVIIKAR